MPCVEEWLSNPLLVIDHMNADDIDSQIKQVKEYFEQRLSNGGVKRVRSINDESLDYIKPNTLVRFRCMIQDMFEPEYYLSSYETVEKASQEKRTNTGLYRDVASCKPGHDVDLNSPKNVTKERQCFYCVPIPGETTWAKKAFTRAAGLQCSDVKDTEQKVLNKLKRDFNDLQQSNKDDISTFVSCTTSCEILGSNGTEEDGRDTKRKKDVEDKAPGRTIAAGAIDLNHPLPGENGPACIVKVYSEFESFKVNDMVEFVGVLSVDPILTGFPHQREDDDVHSSSDCMEVEEQNPHSLPSSLVPRIHAVVGYKMQHSSPLLDNHVQPSTLECLFSEMAHVRGSFLKILEEVLYGDSVAAEYLLLHLISTVYSRSDALAIGKYALNLIGSSKEVAEQVFQMMEFIVPKCYRFPMTITNLNESKLVPKKDYSSNRLVSGKLQLSDDTYLILDETLLEEGQLNNNGVQNISALNHVISWQKVQYDFSFYKTDFYSNLVILVLSETKSLLQADSRVRIEIRKPAVPFAKIVQDSGKEFFDKVRKYIALARLIPYQIDADMQKHIENDFVQTRQASPGEMTVERFHSLLCLARLMAISHGRNHLLQEDWAKMKELEKIRLSRLPQESR